MKLFNGDTVAVIASGPSLTDEDVEAVRGLKKIAVNTTWKKVRDCDVLFAGDHKWWMTNGKEVDIPARRVSLSYNSERQYGAKRFRSNAAKRGGYNSGCVAIEYAIRNGAGKIILLGFDCSVRNGTHWHGDHKKSPNPNDAKCHLWRKQFAELRRIYPDADVVNCSRYTELKTFPILSLEEVLCGLG